MDFVKSTLVKVH